MADVVIFGGTAEGRELANAGARMGISVTASVTSEYGKEMLKGQEGVSVQCGVLDEEGMCRFLRKEEPVLVVDATHPYATLATRQILRACERENIRCVRVLREEREEKEEKDIFWVDTAREAAKLLGMDGLPVLLATGSKELRTFMEFPFLRDRIYARVLPDSRVLAECEESGLKGRRLIAMQGPFSEEMNQALLRQVKAGWLVTKESGAKGGFEEKLEAARKCKVRVIVIRRPKEKNGISVPEAKEELMRVAAERGKGKGLVSWENSDAMGQERQICLIGMGMGEGRQLTLEALEALLQCDVVMGAPRMLKSIGPWIEGKHKEELYAGKDVREWLYAHPEYAKAGVVYSGDTGFYSGCAFALEELKETGGKDREVFRIRIFPGISTLSCLCARLGRSWQDIYPATAHGRDCDVLGLLQEHKRVFLLLGRAEDLGNICMELTEAGMGTVHVSAGMRLGYPDEQVVTGIAGELRGIRTDSLAAVILERDGQTGEKNEG